MIYNITTGESSGNLDPITPNNVQLALKSTDYNSASVVLEGFTGSSFDLDEQIRFRTVASHGSQPGANNGIFLLNSSNLIK